MIQIRFLPLLTISALSLSGCAASGPYPSLAPRPIEQAAAAQPATVPMVVIAPSDPARVARVRALVNKAEAGVAGFNTALSAAQQAVGGGKAKGSDGWISAQVAVSRLERMRETAGGVLSDLTVEQRTLLMGPESDDKAMLEAAFNQVAAIDQSQSDSVRALLSKLGGSR
jgi:hypothetical protein